MVCKIMKMYGLGGLHGGIIEQNACGYDDRKATLSCQAGRPSSEEDAVFPSRWYVLDVTLSQD